MDDTKRAARILKARGIGNVIITMGAKGALVLTDSMAYVIDPIKVKVVDTTGAGDAFNGGLAAALAEGRDIMHAVEFANATAALSVTKVGTAPAMPYRNEIEHLLQSTRS
jgi:ribokinase